MPDVLVPEFIKQVHNRTPGWIDLIHPNAAFSLLMFEGRTLTGRMSIAHELGSWKGNLHKPTALAVERLDETTVLVRGFARYPLPRRGHGSGQVWWLDEIRDGLVWRARGFTSERAAHEQDFRRRIE
jgi:hypothetical protein